METDTKSARQLAFEGWLAEDDRDLDTDDEYTPPELCDRIRDFFGGDIDLDPCAAPGSFVDARVQYFKGDDGLSQSWTEGPAPANCIGHHICTRYVNPPYSRPGPWLQKIVDLHTGAPCGPGTPVPTLDEDPGDTIALVKCDPSTKAWALAWQADAILFFSRRIPFVKPGRTTRAPAKFPCALLYWGGCAEGFAEFFEDIGHVVVREPSFDAGRLADEAVEDLERAGLVRRVEAYGETRYTLAEPKDGEK